MISLIGLSKIFKGESATKIVFDRVDLQLPVDRKLALLGARGSGKTTFLHLLAGIERPSSGKIERRANVSLPVGYSRGFVPVLTARQNAAFFAKCYGADVDEVVAFIQQVTEVGRHFDRPMHEMSAEMRVRILFAISYAIPFDFYLIDGQPAGGSPAFRQICMAMLEERSKTAGILFATPNPRVARRYCDQALLIADRKITLHNNFDEAVSLLKQIEPGGC
jgi:capsular polysaccharide transport system ATP-binding protein